MARYGAAVTPLLAHWSCCSLALIHRYLQYDSQNVWHFSLSNLRISVLFLFSFFFIVIADSALMTLHIAILSLTMMLMTHTCVSKDYHHYYWSKFCDPSLNG